MDKNKLTGLVIIGVILFGFTWYTNKQRADYQRARYVADSIAFAQAVAETAGAVPGDGGQSAGSVTDSAAIDAAEITHLGQTLFDAARAQEKQYVVENDLVKFTFSNRGGRIVEVEMKDYKTFRGDQVKLFTDSMAVFDLSFFIKQQYNQLQVNTGQYAFSTDLEPYTVVGGDDAEKQIVMRLPIDSAAYVEYVYTIPRDDYMIGFDVRFVDLNRLMANQSDFEIMWGSISPQNERSLSTETTYTTLLYKYPNTGTNDMEDLGTSKDSREKIEGSRVKWIAYRQQFFSSVFIADNAFENAIMRYDPANTPDKIKHFQSKISVPFNQATQEYHFKFYYGHNKYTTLRSYGLGLQRMIPLGGWAFGWINRLIVIPLFNFMENFIASYGIIILLLTIFVKLLILPLTYKSYLSSAKMRLLKPEIDALSAKFPKQEDALKKQQAVMALYKSAGVSPMGGCIPMLIQMPILFALFRFFPAAIELRGQSFLWAEDLSSYDSILQLPFTIPFYGNHVSLFTLLMAVSLHLTSRISYNQTAGAGPQIAGMKFMMLYLMPIMLLAFFNNYASGLTYYYLLMNLFTLGQTMFFRGVVDDEKLHARMKANAKKPAKPKSKFMQRYEEALKTQQQQQKQTKRRK